MASGAIKGITVEIGGDTTKLGKALGESEKHSRSLQVELRQIEKLLKFDPTNTELLIQKQNVLADMIAETTNKLNTMKEAEAQVIAQFERGDIGEEQLRAFQREIIQTEKSLGEMKTELQAATRNLDEFGDNNGIAKAEAAKLEKQIQEQNDALEAEKKALQEAEKAQKEHEQAVADAKQTVSEFKDKVGEMAEAVGKGALALGGAAVAGAGYALNLSTNFDAAFNTLITKTGASTEEMDSLNEAMENVYANNFGESIEDVANSMATVKQNTKLSGDELQHTTERALLLRDTFEFDVNESTRSAKMLMDQYGLSAEEAYNLIAQGAQNGLDKNGDLLDTINEYAVHFKSLGYTSEEMFNMLVNGAENGTFSVDKLGDAVKEFGIRAKDGTAADALKDYRKALGLSTKDVKRLSNAMASGGKESKNAMQEVVAAVFKIEDPIKRNTVGVQLFGTMWEDLGEDGVKALMNVEGKISTTSDALDKINEQKYDDIGSALQGLGRTLETEIIKPLGEEFQPAVEEAIEYVQANAPQIREILSGIVEAIGKFVGFIVDNADAILSTIAGIGAGLLVWNVVSMIMGVVEAIKAFKLANEGATIAQALFNAVLNANPIVLLVSVITAVVVAIVTFIATNEEARAKFVEIWNKIKEVASTVWEGIKSTAIAIWDGLKTFFSTTWEGIKSAAITAWDGIKTGLSTAWENIKTAASATWEAIKTAASATWNGIKTFLSTIWEGIKSAAIAVWNGIKTAVLTAWEGLKTGVTTAINTVKTTVTTVWEAIKTAVSTAMEAIKTTVTNIWNTITTTVSTVLTTIQTTISTAWNNITNTASTVLNNLWLTIATVWGNIQNSISTIINGIETVIAAVWDLIKLKVTNAVNSIQTTISTVFTAISTTVTTIWEAIKTTVTTVVDTIKTTVTTVWEAIKSAVSTAMNTINTTISTVWNTIKTTISSVIGGIQTVISSVFEAIKAFLSGNMDAVKSNLSTAWNTIESTITSVVNGIKSVITIVWNGIKSVITSVVNGIKNVVTSVWNGIKNTTSSVFNSIRDIASSVWDSIKSSVSTVVNTIKRAVSSAWDNIKATTANIFNGIKTTISNGLTAAKEAAINVCNSILDGIRNAFSGVASIGANLIEGLWNGISSMGAWIGEKIRGFGEGVLNDIKRFFGIASPSKLMRDEVGRYIAEGIGIGIEKNSDKPLGALKALSEDMANQDFDINGATINRKLATTFAVDSPDMTTSHNAMLLRKLDSIYERLNRLQIVLDTGTLVGETIDKIDASLADKQLLSARGV